MIHEPGRRHMAYQNVESGEAPPREPQPGRRHFYIVAKILLGPDIQIVFYLFR